MKITRLIGRQILDSRGNPTVEADLYLENGMMSRASVPSGASTGTREAIELRDDDKANYLGRGVLKAVEHVNGPIAKALIGQHVEQQETIDKIMINLDSTENKAQLGSNALLSVSLAVAKAGAMATGLPLFKYFNTIAGGNYQMQLPVPLINVINGGKHARGSTDIQEFMIVPVGPQSFSAALRMSSEVFHILGNVLAEYGYATTVGDEGGYAPSVKNGNHEALDLISKAITSAGYTLGKDFVYALDFAASEMFNQGMYNLPVEKKAFTSDDMIHWTTDLISKYPIISVEDVLDQNDWDGWKRLTQQLGINTQIVGDDIFVTNTKFIQKGIDEHAANAVLIKLNQIGTVTETIAAVNLAKKANWHVIVSHRSGETEDTTISHLAVGLGVGEIKTGSLSRSERIAKYNELLRIEESLGTQAVYRSTLPKPIGF